VPVLLYKLYGARTILNTIYTVTNTT